VGGINSLLQPSHHAEAHHFEESGEAKMTAPMHSFFLNGNRGETTPGGNFINIKKGIEYKLAKLTAYLQGRKKMAGLTSS
jgi:hypothetical protein